VDKKKKYKCTNQTYCITNYSGYGPTFGGGLGSDICISDKCNSNNDSYSKFPHSYGVGEVQEQQQSGKSLLSGDYYFTVREIEVF